MSVEFCRIICQVEYRDTKKNNFNNSMKISFCIPILTFTHPKNDCVVGWRRFGGDEINKSGVDRRIS